MGFDKARLWIGGVRNVERLAQMLARLLTTAIEVGSGLSGLTAVDDEQPGSGPLAAIGTGAAVLERSGHKGPVLVVACDLALLDEPVLEMLAGWPGDTSVVPVVGGRPQPLCARWSAEDLVAARALAAAGARSMKQLLARPRVKLLDQTEWPGSVRAEAFSDVDVPADLDRLGLSWSRQAPRGRPRCGGSWPGR